VSLDEAWVYAPERAPALIALDDAHSYALVGTPDRKYLWVLSRTPVMNASLYTSLMEAARTQGFDITRVIKTSQSGAPSR